jgi:hypothetical protein
LNKRILILIMALVLAVSIPVFAEETASTADPGIKPDSPLYILDKLAEKIQIALITDAVKEAEVLADTAQERLAESKAMAEEKNVEKSTKALSEYKELMNKAIDTIDTAASDGKAVTKAIDKIVKYDIDDEEIIDKLMDKVPEEYKAELTKAIEALPEDKAVSTEENKDTEEQAEKVSTVNAVLAGKIQDKALLEKIQNAGLNNRQIAALVSMSEQSGKTLSEVVDLFLTNSKGIGKTIIELKLAPKDAMKDINKTFKEVKKEIKAGLVESKETVKATEDKDSEAVEAKDEDSKIDADKNTDSSKDAKDAEKLEKKAEKASEKLEKKIEQAKENYEKKLEKKTDKVAPAKENDKSDKED